MSDIILQQDPIIGWEAIQPSRTNKVNAWEARIERAWQRRDEEIERGLENGSLDPAISAEWIKVIDYLKSQIN